MVLEPPCGINVHSHTGIRWTGACPGCAGGGGGGGTGGRGRRTENRDHTQSCFGCCVQGFGFSFVFIVVVVGAYGFVAVML